MVNSIDKITIGTRFLAENKFIYWFPLGVKILNQQNKILAQSPDSFYYNDP